MRVDHLEQNAMLFGEQRRNIAYFVIDLRNWNGTSLVLVCCDTSMWLRVRMEICIGSMFRIIE